MVDLAKITFRDDDVTIQQRRQLIDIAYRTYKQTPMDVILQQRDAWQREAYSTPKMTPPNMPLNAANANGWITYQEIKDADAAQFHPDTVPKGFSVPLAGGHIRVVVHNSRSEYRVMGSLNSDPDAMCAVHVSKIDVESNWGGAGEKVRAAVLEVLDSIARYLDVSRGRQAVPIPPAMNRETNRNAARSVSTRG